jgi:hypothetical protein
MAQFRQYLLAAEQGQIVLRFPVNFGTDFNFQRGYKISVSFDYEGRGNLFINGREINIFLNFNAVALHEKIHRYIIYFHAGMRALV